MAVAIVDGHYLLHRCMNVPNLRMLSNKDKKPTGPTFGFIKSLRGTVNTFPEIRKVVCVFDGSHSKRRKAIYPEYKLRSKRDNDLDADGLTYLQKFIASMNYLKFILPRLGIKYIRLNGREGDDTVSMLSKNLDDPLKLIISDDKDMLQLVSDTCHIWRPLAEERVHLGNFVETVGWTKEHFLLQKAILGDSSDNIPGIYGVGAKSVEKLIAELEGDIGPYPHEKFFMAAIEHSSKKINAIGANFEQVTRNFELVDISLELFSDEEIQFALTECSKESEFDVLSVKKFFMHLEFFSIIEDYSRWITPFQLLR